MQIKCSRNELLAYGRRAVCHNLCVWKEVVLKTKLFVGNLSAATTEDDLSRLFSQSGTVSAVELITVKNMGSPKTFAVIDMENEGEAEKAILRLNGFEVKGRIMKVNLAKPREKRPEGRSWYNDPPPPIQHTRRAAR